MADIGVPDRTSILFTGAVELVIGASPVLDIAVRLTISALAVVMTTTAVLLGPVEVIGHLFVVAAVVESMARDEEAEETSLVPVTT